LFLSLHFCRHNLLRGFFMERGATGWRAGAESYDTDSTMQATRNFPDALAPATTTPLLACYIVSDFLDSVA
jgi:hypothetical protein